MSCFRDNHIDDKHDGIEDDDDGDDDDAID